MQQVEFFESLQQQDDATTLLNQFIDQHPDACALPYLVLLRQAHAFQAAKPIVRPARRASRPG